MKKSGGISQNNDLTMKKMDEMQRFWSSLSREEQEKLQEIGVEDLRDYLIRNSSSKNDPVIATFEEAIAFGLNQNQNNVNWEFWLCFACNQLMFTDEESYIQHMLQSHVTQLPELDVVPPNDDFVNMVSNSTWRPLDIPAALKIIQDSPTDDLENQIWPLRAEVLEKIRSKLKQLMDDACFTETNFEFVKVYVTDGLKNIIPRTHQSILLKKMKLHECICFLNVPDLDLLLEFLNVLSTACDTVTSLDEDGSLEESLDTLMSRPIQEDISFSEDRSLLLLDQRLMKGEISPLRYLLPHALEVSPLRTVLPSPTSSFHNNEVDAFIKWIFFADSVRTETVLWGNLKTEKQSLESKFIPAFERNSRVLRSFSGRSRELQQVLLVLQRIEMILVAEDERREKDEMHVPESYESLLKKQLKDIETLSSAVQDKLEDVLKEAETLDVNDYEEQESACMRTWLNDMKSTDKMRRQEAAIRISLKKKHDMYSLERNIIDARLLRINSVKKRMMDEIKRASALDYRAILLSFIQSFLKDRIDSLMMEAAEKKAKAEADQLMAEENKEEKKKNANKQKQKAMKNKKGMEGNVLSQASSDDMLDLPQEEDTEQKSSSVDDIGGFDQLKLEERKLKAESLRVVKMLEEFEQNQLKQLEELKQKHFPKKAEERSPNEDVPDSSMLEAEEATHLDSSQASVSDSKCSTASAEKGEEE